MVGPGGRFSHTTTVVGDIMLFVFGGQISVKVFNDMKVLVLNSRVFTSVILRLSFQRLLKLSNYQKPAETWKLGHLEM
jgi:hypothetical protein